MIAPEIGAALIGAAGGLVSNAGSAHQAFKQRDFIRNMAQHQYQYAVADMRKAGLNPALAYQQGGNSGSGGGSAPEMSNIGDAAIRGAAAAAQLRLLQAQTLDVNSAAKLKDEQAAAVNQAKTIEWNDFMGKNPSGDLTSFGALTRENVLAQVARNVAERENLSAGAARQRADQLLLEVEARAKRLGIPKAEAWSRLWSSVNKGIDWVSRSVGSIQGGAR